MTDTTHSVVEAVARLREVPRGQGHSYPGVGRNGEAVHHVVPYGNMLNEAADLIERQAAAIAAMAAIPEEGWRPIAEAPRDGTPVLLAAFWLGQLSHSAVSQYLTVETNDVDVSGWYISDGHNDPIWHRAFYQCTYFRPLPAPPLENDDG